MKLKYIKQILLLLALSCNLLIPIHSDWYFSVLADSTRPSLKDFLIYPLELVLAEVYFNFGELGVGILQIVHFSSLALLTFFYLFQHKKSFGKANLALILLVSVIQVGVFQYGQDIHPSQLFYLFILLCGITLELCFRSNTRFFTRILLEFIFYALVVWAVLIDWHNFICPLIPLLLSFPFYKKENKSLLIRLVLIVLLTMFITLDLQSNISTFLKTDYGSWFQLISQNHGFLFTYDFGFLILMFSLFCLYSNSNLMRLTLMVLLGGAFFSYRLKVALGIYMALQIINLSRINISSFSKSFNDALTKCGSGLQKVSSEGIIFVLIATIFVSSVSYLKKPVTEQVYPVRAVERHLETGSCPTCFDVHMVGYLKYRFSHQKECLALLSLAPSCPDAKKVLQIKHYNHLADKRR